MRVPDSGMQIDNPAFPLLQVGISYWGITSGDGNVGGTTIVCADLGNQPSFVGHSIKILDGPAWGQERELTNHVPATGTETVGAAFTEPTGGVQQIIAGTRFVIKGMAGGGGGGGGGVVTTGSFNLANNAVEQVALTFAAAQQEIDLELDVAALTQPNIIRIYSEVDGANARQINAWGYPGGFDPDTQALSLYHLQKNTDVIVTMQAIVAEGAIRAIPYRYMVRGL